MTASAANKCGFAGFARLEFGALDEADALPVLGALGFKVSGRLPGIVKLVHGQIAAVLDTREGSFARTYAEMHGPSLAGLAFRVADPSMAWNRAVDAGARPLPATPLAGGTRAVSGIGGIAFRFEATASARAATNASGAVSLKAVDHITFNVRQGQRERWNELLAQAFGFSNVFEAELPVDGTRAMTTVMRSPCGGISLACNEPLDAASPLNSQMHEFNGEGMQHLAFATDNITALAQQLDVGILKPLPVPESHYAKVGELAERAGISVEHLRRHALMIGAGGESGEGWMLQRFTRPALGPSFFEFVQRVNFDVGYVQGTAQTLLETVSSLGERHGKH